LPVILIVRLCDGDLDGPLLFEVHRFLCHKIILSHFQPGVNRCI
jgi:hypothetical protein